MIPREEIVKLVEEGNYQMAIDAAIFNIAILSSEPLISCEILVGYCADLYYTYFSAGDFEKALELNGSAIKLKLQSSTTPDQALIKLYYDRARICESLGLHQQALEIYKNLLETPRKADVLYRMALCYHAMQSNSFADTYYHEAYLAMSLAEGTFSLKTAMVLRDWGLCQMDEKQYAKALSSFGTVKSILTGMHLTDSKTLNEIQDLIQEANQALVPKNFDQFAESVLLFSEIYQPEPLEPLFKFDFPEAEEDETKLIETPPVSPLTVPSTLKN